MIGEYEYTSIDYHFRHDLEGDWLTINAWAEGVDKPIRFTKLRTPNIYAGEGTLYD
ncbi:hypothetical protein [Natrarchaeobaculum sulfurireducens]|uniref:Uncharacterized protein n=1 Tax=Natrarchaeobaculum sulfurireducens TaxID=2044521 RepID=A0A346PPQ9_9EURY|nr:hypothetical protein [Natrarchaeobaculum sulfurireducens]AXR81504.1 hypothetical protein AArcMg_1491 [Natrarchaeobaculum sulfurireducens]